ncbi:MAG: serine protease [Pirellulales bacterium]|nr:serine protease [Pirellulales bacterium]
MTSLLGRAPVVVLVVSLVARAAAQDDQPLDFREAAGAAPLWTAASPSDSLDLSTVVHRLHPSIFLVGTAEAGHGTAFVISQQHRLLATNAHVADIMHATGGEMVAIANGTAHAYQVAEAFYHPGVRRIVGNIAVRTPDPHRGDVYPESPDVAVLRLAPGDELPPAIPLAEPGDLAELLAKPVAMLGYPGHDTECWPAVGQKAEATFRQGVICRITDFTNDVNAPSRQLQFVQHSMASWPGFSGSPIFLPNGHVIALNNCGTTKKLGERITSLAWGVRVDCVWELLKQHGLWNEVSIAARPEDVDVDRYSQPDPAAQSLAEAQRLVAEARIDLMRDDVQAAVDKCNAAAEKAPNLTAVYDVRCIAYNFYATHKIKARNAEAKRYFEYALKDALRAAELEPTSVDHYLDVAVGQLNAANADAPAGEFYASTKILELADELLKVEGLRARDRAYAYRVRALAQGWSGGALDDIGQAIETDPWIPQNYTTLATYWQLHGDAAAQTKALEKARTLSAAIADSDQAWLAATSVDDNRRHGDEARRQAERACEATQYKWWSALRALAAAQAETGEFESAVEYARKAMEAAPDDEAGAIGRQLRSYRRRQPWREEP